MARYEDVSEDPAIVEAIINIKTAVGRIAVVWESTQNDELADAQAELEQAVRWLRGEEVPE